MAAGHTVRLGPNPRPAVVEAAVVVTAAEAVANARVAAVVVVTAAEAAANARVAAAVAVRVEAVAAGAANPPEAVEAAADNEFSGSFFPWARTRSRTGRAIFLVDECSPHHLRA